MGQKFLPIAISIDSDMGSAMGQNIWPIALLNDNYMWLAMGNPDPNPRSHYRTCI